MQAILTKYAGPTGSRGSRIIAWTESGHRVSVPYDYESDNYDMHLKAAHALMKKVGWTGHLIGGGIKNGYAFVFSSGGSRDPRRRRRTYR